MSEQFCGNVARVALGKQLHVKLCMGHGRPKRANSWEWLDQKLPAHRTSDLVLVLLACFKPCVDAMFSEDMLAW